jgi:hypothetical protein
VNARRMEALLWTLALGMLLLGAARWRGADAAGEAPAGALAVTPAEPRRVPRERLAAAGATITGGNPFRLDRAPAPLGFTPPGMPGMPMGPGMMPGMPTGEMPIYAPPPPPRPALAVSGIVGPPWQALLEGVPGREGAVVVRAGDVLGDLRIRDIDQNVVVVAAPDTTWRLTVRNPWQQ